MDSEADRLRAELVARSDRMGDTEFSIKRAALVRAGGWWPASLSDWTTAREALRLART